MSIETMSYVLNLPFHGRGEATRKLMLLGFANHAKADGTAAWPGKETIASYAGTDKRTAQRVVVTLLEDGYMREGDQELVAHIPKKERSVVYDVATSDEQQQQFAIHHAAGGNIVYERNRANGSKGVAAKAASASPTVRGDNLSPLDVVSPAELDTTSRGDNLSPLESRGDMNAGSGVTSTPSRGDTGVTQNVLRTFPTTVPSPSSSPLREPDGGSEASTGDDHDEPASPPPGPSDEPDPQRPEVERLCEHLRDRIVSNGSKEPAITKTWRQAARLMLDVDGRTERQVHNMIDWCQDSSFWRANIMSMPTLRKQYDRLRLRATQDHQRGSAAAATPGVREARRAYSDEATWGRSETAPVERPNTPEAFDALMADYDDDDDDGLATG